MRQELVAAEEVRQPRKIRIRSVGGQKQDQERRVLDYVVQRRFAEHPASDLRDDRLGVVSGLSDTWHNRHAVSQIRNPTEGDRQNHHHRSQRLLGIHPFGRLECRNSVGDGFHACQCGATRGKRTQHQKQRQRFNGALNDGRLAGWTEAEANQSPAQQRDHATEEDIRRQHENRAALADAAQVDQPISALTLSSPG